MPAKNKIVSGAFIAGGIAFLILTVGFYFQLPWAERLWRWSDNCFCGVFIAAVTAAIAAPMIWIGLSGEFGAARGGALSLGVVASGTALYLFYLYSQSQDRHLLNTAVIFCFFVLLNLLIYFWSRRLPIQDQRQAPFMVDFFFVLFSILFILVGWALLRQSPRIFPWPLTPEASVLFGLIFIGAFFYITSALPMPLWNSSRGQLLAMLAYDLVLIGPFLNHFSQVDPAHYPSLLIFTIVITFTALLAIYFLFINKSTRSWRIIESE